jgi:hypothetical protein
MENIFYAVLALHIAGKPVNKENIRAVLEAAGASVNEAALDAMAAFVESLAASRDEKERTIDPRIIKFLSSELAQRKVQTEQLRGLLEELTESVLSAPEAHETRWPQPITAEAEEKGLKTSQMIHQEEEISTEGEEAIDKEAKVAEEAAKESETAVQPSGRYIYGIAANREKVTLGEMGIEGNEVYTIPYEDVCAIVHNCPAEPYQSQDNEVVKEWVKIHQGVLDEAQKQFGTVIPLGFDTILQPKDDITSPDQVVRDWLREDYDRLLALMEKIKGKEEYGIQIFYDTKIISEIIAEQSEEIKKIKEEMSTKSPGMAYMYKQKLESAAKAEMERLADRWFKDFYSRIKQYVDDIEVGKVKKAEKGKVMLLNLSCLVSKEKIENLGEELEKINNMDGFSVRFTGPWPPYSFVAKPIAVEEK